MNNTKTKEKAKNEKKIDSKQSNNNIFRKLGLKEEYEDNKLLFALQSKTSNKMNDSECVKRIRFVLKTYWKWIAAKRNKEAIDMNLYDLISIGFGVEYGMNGFLRDYRYAIHTNRDCFGYDNINILEAEEKKENDLHCDIDDCFIVHRVNRNKKTMTENNKARDLLFFASDSDSDSNANVYCQEIMDALHCFVYHTPKINATQFFADYVNEKDVDEKEEIEMEIEDLIIDDIVIKFGALIRKTRESSKRFRNSRNERYKSEKNNKFMTGSNYDKATKNKMQKKEDEYDNIAAYQSSVYGNDQLLLKKEQKIGKIGKKSGFNSCWMDEFYKEIRRGQINNKSINKMYKYINNEEFESDSIYSDISTQKECNLLREFNAENNNKLNKIFAVILTECDMENNIYDPGFRFFYWPHYKNNQSEWNILYRSQYSGKPSVEGNKGYTLGHWYIDKKYDNFKQEILGNLTSPFSLNQFQNTLAKATQKRANWIKDPDVRKLECTVHYLQKLYGMKEGDVIKVHHIMAIMFYCNFGDHSFVFSGTFRRNDRFETDYLLKRRHSEYYFWGRYLRECVECFGIAMDNKACNISVFYHGISKSLLFETTNIYINGPISTTRDFTIAWTIFGATGIVLDIKNTKTAAIYFDCNYWTCYTSEDEKLFIGCRSPLTFMDIHDIPKQEHYKDLVKVINICDYMFSGFPLVGIKPLKRDCKSLNKLIKCELDGDIYANEYDSIVPQYVAFLFHQFMKTKTEIVINSGLMDKDFWLHSKQLGGCDVYGFKKFESIVIRKEDSSINFRLFLNLMKNLTTITIFNAPYSKYEASIVLDDSFLCEIMFCIDLLLKTGNMIFTQFIIVKPMNSIQTFINKNKQIFGVKGWAVNKMEYSHPRRKGKCSDTLSIYKLK